jgi:hypothetical protein
VFSTRRGSFHGHRPLRRATHRASPRRVMDVARRPSTSAGDISHVYESHVRAFHLPLSVHIASHVQTFIGKICHLLSSTGACSTLLPRLRGRMRGTHATCRDRHVGSNELRRSDQYAAFTTHRDRAGRFGVRATSPRAPSDLVTGMLYLLLLHTDIPMQTKARMRRMYPYRHRACRSRQVRNGRMSSRLRLARSAQARAVRAAGAAGRRCIALFTRTGHGQEATPDMRRFRATDRRPSLHGRRATRARDPRAAASGSRAYAHALPSHSAAASCGVGLD